MALKFLSNLESVAGVFRDKITEKEIIGWTKAGLLNAMSGEGGRREDFQHYVRTNYLQNGRALGVRDERDPEWKKRGWHHYQTMLFYTPKARRKGTPEVRAGLYGSALKNIAGITTYNGSLNYLAPILKDKGYLRNAWRSYQGNTKAREDLLWMFQHGIDKKIREEGKAEK